MIASGILAEFHLKSKQCFLQIFSPKILVEITTTIYPGIPLAIYQETPLEDSTEITCEISS